MKLTLDIPNDTPVREVPALLRDVAVDLTISVFVRRDKPPYQGVINRGSGFVVCRWSLEVS